MYGKTLCIVLLVALASMAPIFSALADETPPPASQVIVVRVDGASCPFCAFGLEKRLGRLDGVLDVRMELKAGKAMVTLKKGATVSEDALRQAVKEAGFTAKEIIFPLGMRD